MKHLNIMLKPASSACNMRCKYCFYADVSSKREVMSYGVMTRDVRRNIIRNVFSGLESGDSVGFAFQGGEPTLAGLDFFRCFIDEVNETRGAVKVNYAFQTNGYLLDSEWCDFLKTNKFLMGLSLDGSAALHNANRVDASGAGTFARVFGAKRLMEKMGVEYNVLTVLTNEAARHPGQLWTFYKQNKISYVQFIPCLDELDCSTAKAYALTPKRYAEFYKTLFSLWLADWKKGEYTSIKLFDDTVNLLAYGRQTACGILGSCYPQIVVEADGSVYPCDFYVLDEYRLGNLATDDTNTIMQSPVGRAFAQRAHTQPKLCQSCPYKRICNGGCKRMQPFTCCSGDDTYCGHKDFLDVCLPDMQIIAGQIVRNRA